MLLRCPGRTTGKEQGKQREKASLSAVAAEGLTSCDLVGSPVDGMTLQSSPNEFRELGLGSLTRICHGMGLPRERVVPLREAAFFSQSYARCSATTESCLPAALPKAVVINL